MVTRRLAIERTPLLTEGAFGVAMAGGTSGALTSLDVGTDVKAGVVERKSSSAPGRFALRVIVRLLGRLVHVQGVDTMQRHQMMRHT